MASRTFAVKSVAIIGGGACGLTTAKYMIAQGVYDRVVVYERRPDVGGVWNHTFQPTAQNPVPQVSPYLPPGAPEWLPTGDSHGGKPEFPTAMYDLLYVNIPHPLMGFTDLPIADVHRAAHPDEPLLIFPQRQVIQAYLERYAQDMRHLIRFGTNVDDVRLRTHSEVDSWEVHATDTSTGAVDVNTFDAVVVAHGHYDTPFVPAIPGLAAFHAAHPGVVSHSKRYRSAAPFRGQRVVVVGNSASGLDIAGQIAAVCAPPLVLSVRAPTDPDALARLGRLGDVHEAPEIREFLVAERGVRLADGRVVRDVDAVVFCTGFLYSLPFLERGPQNLKNLGGPPLLTTGRRIHRLYDDLFHIDHPTLAFVGLPIKVIPYAVAQAQAAVLARTWANTLPLPSRQHMEAWERQAEQEREASAFHVWAPGQDSRYINATYKRIMEAAPAGKEPPRWSDRLVWMRTITPQGKGRFEDMGYTATTLEELGFVYGPEAGADAACTSNASACSGQQRAEER